MIHGDYTISLMDFSFANSPSEPRQFWPNTLHDFSKEVLGVYTRRVHTRNIVRSNRDSKAISYSFLFGCCTRPQAEKYRFINIPKKHARELRMPINCEHCVVVNACEK